MRYTLAGTKDSLHTTKIYDISSSGIAFTIAYEAAPPIGSNVKVEFAVPGTKKRVAWFARVVRIQERLQSQRWADRNKTKKLLVGMKFTDMPKAQVNLIHTAIINKRAELAKRIAQERIDNSIEFFIQNIGKAILVLSLIALLFTFFWLFTSPAENFGGKPGTPWGRRMHFKPGEKLFKFPDQ